MNTAALSSSVAAASPPASAGPVSPTASQRIASFVCAFGPGQLTPELNRQVARSWLDTVAVALAGGGDPASLRARRYVEQQYGLAAAPASSRARLWGSAQAAPLEAAALWNGIAGHVLDYDDVTTPMRGHPSIALWPALLALADARALPGARLASAFVVGFEVICKLSRGFAARHYARGWHSTSSIGVLGAAAAAAHLIGLDAARTVSALGLAVAMAAGTRQNFGSDAKSFQAGQCNAAALRAVLLAEQGFDAAPGAIDGEFGYLALVGHGEDLGPALATLGNDPPELLSAGIEIKQYPMCYAAHRSIDAVLALRREHGLTLDQVQAVDIQASRGAFTPLIHRRPVTGLQGKFSLEYGVTAALADGAVRLASFDDAAVQRTEVQAFLPRVRSREATGGTLEPRYAEVALRLRDGTTLRHRVDAQHGAAEDPLSDEELIAKVADCLAYGGSRIDARHLYQRAIGLPGLPARALLDALQG